MAILHQAIMAKMNKMAIMAVRVWIYMAINMVNIGVYAKNRKNVDKLLSGHVCFYALKHSRVSCHGVTSALDEPSRFKTS